MVSQFSSRSIVEKPKAVIPWPEWPGANAAIKYAQFAARENPPLGIQFRFGDGSEMILEYQLFRMPGHKLDEMYDKLEPPLLSALVLDHLHAVKRIKGLAQRVQPHDAERALQELQQHLGKDYPVGVMSASIDESDSRRRYFFRCQ
jgi:hypothetical protein